MSQPPNKKVPESAAQTRSVDHPVYLHMITDVLGRVLTTHANPNKPKEAFQSTVNHDGTFSTKEVSDKFKGMNTSHKHHERSNAGSSSKNNDGPVDSSAQGTKNSNVMGDSGGGVKGTEYKGSTKQIGGSAEGAYITTPGGKSYLDAGGDLIFNIKGRYDINVKDDSVSTTYGNQQLNVLGNFGLHVQKSKGIGIVSDNGKITVKTADVIEIEAGKRITLSVGNTYITMIPGGIEIGTDGFINVFVNKGSDNLSIINYGSGRAQMGTNGGEATIAGNSIVLKSKTGTTIEKTPTLPPLPWPGVTK